MDELNDIKILVVEDDPIALEANKILLSNMGHVIGAKNAESAHNALCVNDFDIAFFDLKLQGELHGIDLIKVAKEKGIYSIVISGESSKQTMENAFMAGCEDYLLKPIDRAKLNSVIDRYFHSKSVVSIDKMLKDRFITKSQKLLKELSIICNLKISDKPIFLHGDTGTGKRVIAHIIRDAVKCPEDKFIEVNCSHFNSGIIKSELFGHEKGSFTGADKNKAGLLKLADNGIIFLDEIHTLSLEAQKMLLKAIEEKKFYPVGSDVPVESNFRIISASCENLKELVKQGLFRQDLFARITTFNIKLPPIRSRREDIAPLFDYFISKYKFQIVITDEAMIRLEQYNWPNNTREIQDLVENWAIQGQRLIKADMLPLHIKHNVTDTTSLIPDSHIEYVYEHGLSKFIKVYKRELMQEILNRQGGVLRKASQKTGMASSTICEYIKNNKDLRLQ